jgi:predicted alpha/beta superfamily hydrolase
MRGEEMKRVLMGLLLLFSGAVVADERPHTAGPGVQVLAPMHVPGLDRERIVRVYLPPDYATSKRRYPVLYMHDGQNLFDDATSFVGEWGVDEAMDQLAKEGIEAIVVGIDHGGEHRFCELTEWPRPGAPPPEGREYLAFVVKVVKPYVDAHYRTRPDRKDTAIMGSSLGGLISHAAAFEYADVFSKIGEFSPSFWYAPAAYDLSAKQKLPPGTRIYMVCGDHEGSDQKDHDETVANMIRMEAMLRREQPGLRLRSVVRAGGEHNERFWRAEFPAAMRFLFGRN